MKLKLIKICAVFGILGIFAGCSDNVPPQQEKPQEKQQEKTVETENVVSEQSNQRETDDYRTLGIPRRDYESR